MERRIGPRFHRDAKIPEVPKGMVLVKFHGEPALIPVKEEGEPMFGKTSFTVGQAAALIELERQRWIRAMLEDFDQTIYDR